MFYLMHLRRNTVLRRNLLNMKNREYKVMPIRHQCHSWSVHIKPVTKHLLQTFHAKWRSVLSVPIIIDLFPKEYSSLNSRVYRHMVIAVVRVSCPRRYISRPLQLLLLEVCTHLCAWYLCTKLILLGHIVCSTVQLLQCVWHVRETILTSMFPCSAAFKLPLVLS